MKINLLCSPDMFRSIPERPYTYRKQMPNTDLTLELTNDYDVPRALLLFARLRGLFARPRFEISDL